MRLGDEPRFRATVIKCDRYEARAVWDDVRHYLKASTDRGIGDLTEGDLADRDAA